MKNPNSPSTIRIVLCSVLFFSIVLCSYSQEKISKTQFDTDLDILKTNLEQIHGDLYLYSSKQEIDNWFEETKRSISDSITRVECYKKVAPLNSLIKNGHTSVKYPRFGDNFYFLPFQLHTYKDSFFLKKSFSKEQEHIVGLEILEINGEPILDIYNDLLKNHTRDGVNLTFPSEHLSMLFGLDYSLIHGSKSTYEITVLKDKKPSTISVKSVLLNDEVRGFYNNQSSSKPLGFEFKGNIGVLTFPTFSGNELKKANYRSVLKDAFDNLQKSNTEHLIIDVRNNGGGDPVPTQELLSYLLDQEFVMYKDVYTITNKIRGRKYFKKQGLFLLNTLSWLQIKKIRENHYRLRSDQGMDIYPPKDNYFKGKIYVLTNGNSFSATGEFTSFLKNNREVVFIGEEVGGNKLRNTSGVSYTLTLPHSKQRIDIPIVVWEMNVDFEKDGHGVRPDHWVKNTIEEELEGIDSVMDFTLDLIKGTEN